MTDSFESNTVNADVERLVINGTEWIRSDIADNITSEAIEETALVGLKACAKEKQEAAKSIREVITCYKTAYDNAQKCPEMILSSGSTEKAKVLMRELKQARKDLFGIAKVEI